MNYKLLQHLIALYRPYFILKVQNNEWNMHYQCIYDFLQVEWFSTSVNDIITATNCSKKRWYKGAHVFNWFNKVIYCIVYKKFNILGALAENTNIAGYRNDGTNHRRLFYKIAKMMMSGIAKICQCQTREDLISLNFLLAFKFSKAGRPKTAYKQAKINDMFPNSLTYDEIVIGLWKFISKDTVGCKSLMINMCNDCNFNEYLRRFVNDSEELCKKHQWLMLIYNKYKNDPFFRQLNLYRLNKILKNNGIPFYRRKLGNKPKTITKIRIEGLFQVDVKITHCGDLKYFDVGYWMVIVEVEHGLIFRRFLTCKPTGYDHVQFLDVARNFFWNSFEINFDTIQMDNAPEYAKKFYTQEEIEAHNMMVNSVGSWTAFNKIRHINIRKGRKESNGKVENSNRMIDFELLPLIHRSNFLQEIQSVTTAYDYLHNFKIRRKFRRIINGKLTWMSKTPNDWLTETRYLVKNQNLVRIPYSNYYWSHN